MGKFLIITCVHHGIKDGDYYAYGPYVREMNLWIEKEEEVIVMAPLFPKNPISKIDLAYKHPRLKFVSVPAYDVQSLASIGKAIFRIPLILFQLTKWMAKVDHIHVRTPGNMGLLAMFVQILFPKKEKTIKYAGNWDPESIQPKTYKIQRWLENSTTFTKNAKVLVYGDWPDSSINIVPFFTASYKEEEKEPVFKKPIQNKVNLIFVGALYDGKNPEVGIQVAKKLKSSGVPFHFDYCGDGVMREELELLSKELGVEKEVEFHGNVNSDTVKNLLKEAHLLVFASRTEGWPKAVAEAMFWGCVPLTSKVSCVPQMIGGEGERGFLISKDPNEITQKILNLYQNPELFNQMSEKAINWSRKYTLEMFKEEIEKLK